MKLYVLLWLIVALTTTGCTMQSPPTVSSPTSPPVVVASPFATYSTAPQATPPQATPVPTIVPKISTREVPSATPPFPTPTNVAKLILSVPIFHQEHALSCEAAALRMAMGGLGKRVSEESLLAKLARDPTPRRVLGDGTMQWGDPDVGFVGEWDGAYLKDGYGVYEGPIADLALANGLKGTTHSHGISPQELYSALKQGFPSVVWAPYDLIPRARGTWTTPFGKQIDYVVTEHALVLAGLDAGGVYYADPMKAELQHAPFAEFEKAMGELERRAVVLRP